MNKKHDFDEQLEHDLKNAKYALEHGQAGEIISEIARAGVEAETSRQKFNQAHNRYREARKTGDSKEEYRTDKEAEYHQDRTKSFYEYQNKLKTLLDSKIKSK